MNVKYGKPVRMASQCIWQNIQQSQQQLLILPSVPALGSKRMHASFVRLTNTATLHQRLLQKSANSATKRQGPRRRSTDACLGYDQ